MRSFQSYLTLFDPMYCSPPGSYVHGILQARKLERVAMLSSRGSSWQGIKPVSLMPPVLAGGFFTTCRTWWIGPPNLREIGGPNPSWRDEPWMMQLRSRAGSPVLSRGQFWMQTYGCKGRSGEAPRPHFFVCLVVRALLLEAQLESSQIPFIYQVSCGSHMLGNPSFC